MIRIGVLALQGSVAEHMKMLSLMDGITPCEVRRPEEIETVSGMILPGGESTTIGKLIKTFHLEKILVDKIAKGMPVWGTCAGMILLAKEIVGEKDVHLGIMDVSVRRNAYGGQLDSFCTNISIPAISKEEIPLVFIRAPWVEKVWGSANVLAYVDKQIVAVEQGNMLATSFHPELTKNRSFHEYFACKVKQSAQAD